MIQILSGLLRKRNYESSVVEVTFVGQSIAKAAFVGHENQNEHEVDTVVDFLFVRGER